MLIPTRRSIYLSIYNGTYGVVPELAAQLPALASTCMAVKGLTYKSTWEAWAPFAVTLDGGDAWTFDVKKPEEGLILVGGELGPIDASLFIGSENFIRYFSKIGEDVWRNLVAF